MIVSLEAISVQEEEKQNDQLLDLSRRILELTDEIRMLTIAHAGASGSS